MQMIYGKVTLNIQKVFAALNEKDYNYVYKKLADGFKQNYFNTLEEFEAFTKDNFFDKMEVEYLVYKKESEDYYSYSIRLKDKNSSNTKDLRIIMKLQSGTDFVMSFNVD